MAPEVSGIDELLNDPEISKAATPFLRAAKARQEGRRCTCDLREAQWSPIHGLCFGCGGLSWDRKWWSKPAE